MNAAVEEMADILYEDMEFSKRNPNVFLKETLQQNESDQWQIDGLEAIADVFRKLRGEPTKINHEGLNRITVRSCHGPGKTHWLAQVLHWWNYCFSALAVGTAPKEKQITTRLMPRYRKILRGSIPGYKDMIKTSALSIKILGDTDWGFSGETASDPDNMAGYHDEPQLFIIDEASAKVLDPMFPVIEGTLTTPGSVLVMIGNPTRTRGEFYDSHNKDKVKDQYFQIHIKPSQSRYIDPKWMDQMKRKYGKDSPIYKVRCLGDFAEMEENQLIALEWLENARHEWQPDGSHPILKISCDVADGGLDETVITVAEEYQSFIVLKKIYRFSFPHSKAIIMSGEAMERIAEANHYDINRGDLMIVDGVGVGAGTAGHLIKKRKYNVVVYKSGNTYNINTKMYKNQRTRSFLSYRDGLIDGSVIIDPGFCNDVDWEDFTAQNCSIKNKPGDDRIEDLVSKKDMKADGVVSPDMADSPAMLFNTYVPVIGGTAGDTALEVVGESLSSGYDGGLL